MLAIERFFAIKVDLPEAINKGVIMKKKLSGVKGAAFSAACLGLASLGLSASVHAVHVDANGSSTDTYTVTSFPYNNAAQVTGNFADFYDFTISDNNTVASNAINLDLVLNDMTIYNIDGFAAELWGNNSGTWDFIDSGLDLDGTLANNDYRLIISGDANGNSGGLYTVAISAVPIPAAVWLFGSGLVGLAAVARRKKSENVAADALPA